MVHENMWVRSAYAVRIADKNASGHAYFPPKRVSSGLAVHLHLSSVSLNQIKKKETRKS